MDEKTITLTSDELFIIEKAMDSYFSWLQRQITSWGNLAKEVLSDGTPRFQHAADNAKWCEMEIERTEKIIKIL